MYMFTVLVNEIRSKLIAKSSIIVIVIVVGIKFILGNKWSESHGKTFAENHLIFFPFSMNHF